MSVSIERERELGRLLADNYQLSLAYLNNPFVRTCFNSFLNDRCTLEEAFIKCIESLTAENKRLFDELVKKQGMEL